MTTDIRIWDEKAAFEFATRLYQRAPSTVEQQAIYEAGILLFGERAPLFTKDAPPTPDYWSIYISVISHVPLNGKDKYPNWCHHIAASIANKLHITAADKQKFDEAHRIEALHKELVIALNAHTQLLAEHESTKHALQEARQYIDALHKDSARIYDAARAAGWRGPEQLTISDFIASTARKQDTPAAEEIPPSEEEVVDKKVREKAQLVYDSLLALLSGRGGSSQALMILRGDIQLNTPKSQ